VPTYPTRNFRKRSPSEPSSLRSPWKQKDIQNLRKFRPRNGRGGPTLPPRGGAKPFVPRAPKGFGPKPSFSPLPRSGPGLGKLVPGLGLALGIGGLLDGYFHKPLGYPAPRFPDPSRWIFRHGPNTYNVPGYTVYHGPHVQDSINGYIQLGYSGPETGKIAGQAIGIDFRKPLGDVVPAGSSRVSYWEPSDSYARFAQTHMWQKDHPDPQALLEQGGLPAWNTIPRPAPLPDPFELPPRYRQYPYPPPLAFAPPPLQPPLVSPVPMPPPDVLGDEDYFDEPLVDQPVVRPPDYYSPPAVEQDFPDTGPPTPPTLTRHWHQPPPKGEKERKGKLRRGFERAMDIFGEITEYADIVDAAWKALPDNLKTKTYYRGRVVTSIADKFGDVYRHAGQMDVGDFVINLIENHYQDLAIGLQSQLRNKLLPDGIAGIDVFNWIDKLAFGGEVGRATDLSGYASDFGAYVSNR
jgi:hypothetical protein